MFTTLTKLFAAPPAARRSADAKTRLGLEALGDRTLMSATAAWGVAYEINYPNPIKANDVLTVTADATGSAVEFRQSGAGTARQVWATDNGKEIAGSRRTNPLGSPGVTFLGGAGNDSCLNSTGRPMTAHGGPGRDILTGGAGNDRLYGDTGHDVFVGSPGSDVYVGGDGEDVLDRRGNHGFFDDGSADDTTYDSVGGEAPGRLTPAELKAVGQLNAFQAGDRVWLTGPSGAGFALKSQWSQSTTGDTVAFTTKSQVTLETAWGNVTLPGSDLGFSVKGGRTRADGVAKSPTFYLGGVPLTSAGLTDNAAGKFFDEIKAKVAGGLASVPGGADLTLPGVSWGVDLGSGIKAQPGNSGDPLNPAVPYLFGSALLGAGFKYGGVSLNTPGIGGTVAFAPGDGTLYADAQGIPILGDVAVGVSTEGYLPFTPKNVPTGTRDPNMYGHAYLRGEIDVPVPETPLVVKVNGDLLIDLDANDDGAVLSNKSFGNQVKAALGGLGGQLGAGGKIAADAMSVLGDVGFGMNAGVGVSLKDFLNLDLADSTFWRTPTEVAFRGKTSDPFAGVPFMSDIKAQSGVDVQGYVKTDALTGQVTSWRASAEVTAGTVAGLPVVGLRVEAGSQLDGVQVTGSVGVKVKNPITHDVIYHANVEISGTVHFDGSFELKGSLDVDIGALDIDIDVTLKRQTDGHFSVDVDVDCDLDL